jgi:hypothetical protein
VPKAQLRVNGTPAATISTTSELERVQRRVTQLEQELESKRRETDEFHRATSERSQHAVGCCWSK